MIDMRRFVFLLLLGWAPALSAGPTNSILFVTQVPVPADFGTIASTFGNQQGDPNSCGRGGDLYIRYWLTFAPGEIRTCTSCHGINEETQANGPMPTNTPLALIKLLNYWKTNAVLVPAVAAGQGTNYFQITFVHRPAESGVTYHVQASGDLAAWSDIATYSSSNSVLTAQAAEISRAGSPDESVTIRDLTGMNGNRARFLRVSVTQP
jgi:hypothetical protein